MASPARKRKRVTERQQVREGKVPPPSKQGNNHGTNAKARRAQRSGEAKFYHTEGER